MIAPCIHHRGLLLGAVAAGVFVACGSGDLVVGDDSRDDSRVDGASGDGGSGPDGNPPNDDDGASHDAGNDGPAGSCSAAPNGPGTCLPNGTACRQADTTGLTCPTTGAFCCVQPCPELAQPPPGFCDGGPSAPVYDTKACVVGFACAPVACADAGGACVALTPGSCATGHTGDATKYSCGPGIGVMCCLP